MEDKLYSINILKNLKYDLGQNRYCFIPSLKYITLLEFAFSLWRSKVGHSGLWQTNSFGLNKKMKIFESEVQKKIFNLIISQNYKDDLERMSSVIRKEITDYFVNKTKYSFLNESYQVYWDNLRWTQQGSINTVETIKQIIKNSNLSIIEKYILACDNCLEEEIRQLYKLVPNSFFISCKGERMKYLVLFWTVHVKGKDEKFCRYNKGIETYFYLFKWAIECKREVAVKYIWENYSSLFSDLIDGINLFSDCEPNPRILYFLHQINKIQLVAMSVEMHKCLLLKLKKIMEWYNIIVIEEYVHDIINSMEVFDALSILIFCWNKEVLDSNQYYFCWDCFTLNFKANFENDFITIGQKFLDNFKDIEFTAHDVTAYILLLRMGTYQNKKELMYNHVSMFACSKLIYYSPESFEDLLRETFEKEKHIVKFRKHFFKIFKKRICDDLIETNNYDRLDTFLNNFCIKKIISEFKAKFFIKRGRYIINKISKRTGSVGDLITDLDKFINWANDNNTKKIARYKMNLFVLEKYKEEKKLLLSRLEKLINRQNWLIMGKHLKWIYSATMGNINYLKDKFEHLKNILFLIVGEDFRERMKFLGNFVLIMRSVTVCFKLFEIDDIKIEIDSSMDLYVIVFELIELGKYQEADVLINWCYSTDKDKRNEFKLVFILSIGITKLLRMLRFYYSVIPQIISLLDWFNLYGQTADFFKTSFMTIFEERLLEFTFFLDDPILIFGRRTKFLELLAQCIKEKVADEEEYNPFSDVELLEEIERKVEAVNMKMKKIYFYYY